MIQEPISVHESGERRSRYPFLREFSCRQAELDAMLASLKNFFRSADLTDGDRATLEKLVPPSERGDALVPVRPVVLVGGSSGMGKTRILQEATRQARAWGLQVKEVFCYERQGIPFLPILRLVKDLLVESPQRGQLWDRYSHILSRVYPELVGEVGEARVTPPLPDERGKIQLFDALTSILTSLGRERPLLLALHDLHRSDRGTIEFLEYLGRNVFLEVMAQRAEGRAALDSKDAGVSRQGAWREIRQRRERWEYLTEGFSEEADTTAQVPSRSPLVMVLANYLEDRTPGVEPTAPATLSPEREVTAEIAELCTESFVQHLALPPLDPMELGALIRRTVCDDAIDDAVVARLHAATGGNPLYVLELCRAMYDRAVPPGTEPPTEKAGKFWLTLPALEQVVAAGAAETASSPETAAVLDAAGAERLAGNLLLQRAAALPSSQSQAIRLLATVRRPLHVSRLVYLLGVPRQEVEETLTQLQLQDFVSVIPIDRAPRFQLAHEDFSRFIYGALGLDERREQHGLIGQALSQQQATVEPVRSFEVYDHLRESTAPRESIPFGLSAARYFADGYALRLAVKIEADLLALLTEPDDQPQRIELLADLARHELRLGALEEAKLHAKRLIDEGGQLRPQQRLDAYELLAEAYGRKGEPLKSIKVLNRAEKVCAAALDDRSRARIAALRSRRRLDRQDVKRAINLSMRGLQAVENVEGAEPEIILLLDCLAEAHLSRSETGAALPHYQRLLELVESVGDETRLAAVLSRLGRVYYDRGNYFRSARFLFKALDVIRRLGDIRGLSEAYDALGKVYRNSGDDIRGIEYFNRSLRIRERIGDLEGLSPTLNSLGSLYAHSGDYHRAVLCFQRSVRNSERFGDTSGLVRAFLHLGWIYYQLGELRQVESLAKQILILSQEFGLFDLEGEGHRLQGSLLFLRGDWRRAEREYRRAIEMAAKRSWKRGEAAASLDLGELLGEKEDYEAALKLISRAQLLAEEIRSIPMRARANLLKGNVYRFLKGGNVERAKESIEKGSELLSGENPLPLLWELEYSLAKLHQSHLEFDQAAKHYARAQEILDRIAAGLPEDMQIAYRDDRRRKLFFEDYRRFQKESAGRSQSSAEPEPMPAREEIARPSTSTEGSVAAAPDRTEDALIEAIERLTSTDDPERWLRMLLDEARRLVPSPAGAVARERIGGLEALAARDMGPTTEWVGRDRFPGALCAHALATGQPAYSGSQGAERVRDLPGASGYRNRSVLALPFSVPDRFKAVLYLQRPSAGNSFSATDVDLLGRFLRAVRGHYRTVEALRRLRYHRRGGLLSVAGLEERLDALLAAHLAGERPIALLEAQVPGIERALGDGTQALEAGAAAALQRLVARWGGHTPAYLGNDHLAFLLEVTTDADLAAAEAELRSGLRSVAESLPSGPLGTIEVRALDVDLGANSGADEVFVELQSRLSRHAAEFHVETEIDRLSTTDLTLKEAKSRLERRYITAQLLKSGGNITRAAESLGVHRPQLSNLIKKHNVRREDFE
ncbi:MAG: tetratricopeptide repeat protein [Planctomycetota bacterium]